MSFTPKDWKDYPDTTTPLSALAIEDLETRLSDYTDLRIGGGDASVYNVKDYGAVGNGGLTDDTTAIQDAIDAAEADGGGKVYIPRGEYKLTASLVVPSWITIGGPTIPQRAAEYGLTADGGFALLVIGGGKNFPLITNSDTVTGNTSIGLEDLRFQVYDATSSSAEAVLFNRQRRSWIRRCYVFGAATTERRGFHYKGSSEQNFIEDSYLEGMGIYSEASNSLSVLSTEVGQAGIELFTGYYHQVKNCQIYSDGVAEGAGYAAWPTGVKLDRCHEGHVVGNSVYAFQNDGIWVDSSDHCTVAENDCVGNSRQTSNIWAGIHLGATTSATNCEKNIVVSNQSYCRAGATLAQKAGLRMSASGGGGAAVTNNLITANNFRNNNAATDVTAGTLNRVFQNEGVTTPTVASTAALTLPAEDDVITVSGTAAITSITADYPGRRVTLIFSGTAAGAGLTDGSNLKLSANLGYTPDDAITLVSNGTNWYETGRSVN